jgi:hypothetical protein
MARVTPNRLTRSTPVALALLLFDCAPQTFAQTRQALFCDPKLAPDEAALHDVVCPGVAARPASAVAPWVDPFGCKVGEIDDCQRRCKEDTGPPRDASCNNLAVTLELDACVGQRSCPAELADAHVAAAAAEVHYHDACGRGHEGACSNSRRLASHGMRISYDRRTGTRFSTDVSAAASYGTESLRRQVVEVAGRRRFDGALTVEGAPFTAVTCQSLEGIGAFGVELRDAAGARVRLVAEVDGSATVAVLSAGAAVGKRLPGCGELALAPTRLTLDHVRVLEGTARLTCGVAGTLTLRCGPP